MNLWTNEEIDKILLHLDDAALPFKKFTLRDKDGGTRILGKGGSANVYEAWTRTGHREGYALKVIGFFDQNVDSELFNDSVSAQKEIGEFFDYVVKIYNHTEIWLAFDGEDEVVYAGPDRPGDSYEVCMRLQFILMEKLPAVIKRNGIGKIDMTPEELLNGDEKEILKLAYDVGMALKKSHDKKILHRDVKLENVFYSEKQKLYKLGDFGIAKKTEDGFAGTVAFTRGYAAPEVLGNIDSDRYDHTADIYSFGMMIYVLSNRLKFPESGSYKVNQLSQYSNGYILPPPENEKISDKLYRIMVKACMYDPDDRYQSMDEILLDIEKVLYSDIFGYEKENKSSSLIVGVILFTLGVITWKLIYATDMVITFSVWEYIFLALCTVKGALKLFDKNTVPISGMMFVLGGVLLISRGFSVYMLLLYLWVVFTPGTSPGFIGEGVFIASLVSYYQTYTEIRLYGYSEYSWITITMISLAIGLMHLHAVMCMEGRKLIKQIYGKGIHWCLVFLVYIEVFVIGKVATSQFWDYLAGIVGNNIINVVRPVNYSMVGGVGFAFCLFYYLREQLLIQFQKIKKR